MKVLVCAYSCLSESGVKFIGGEASLGWNGVKHLSRFHQVWVLTHLHNRQAIEETLLKHPLPNVKFYYIDLPRWLRPLECFHKGGIQIYAYLWQIKAYSVARKLHKEFQFDLFHHLTYANDWMASFIGAFLPIPYIRGPGGGAHKVPKNFLSEFSLIDRLAQYLRNFGQWIFRHDPFFILSQKKAKAILVCNKESFEAIPKKLQQKTYLFPVNGISKEDLKLFSKSEKKNDNKFKVLSAGKLLPIKGFSLAIKAFKFFSDKVKDTELKIIGDGPEFPHLKNLVQKLKIENKVQFKKWMSRNEFLKELGNCDLFLFPSLRDGGGQVVIEAMAAEKPVICLDIAGPGFHVQKEWGIKVRPHFPKQAIKEMAEALERLYLNKELRARLGKVARERVEKVYLWDRLGEHLLKIYQRVLGI